MNPICLTMGDPAGVGPELIVRLLGQLKPNSPPLVIIGDWAVLKAALNRFGNRNARCMFQSANILKTWPEKYSKAPLTVLSTTDLDSRLILQERGLKKHGFAMWKYIEQGVRLCKNGICSALVTLPVNKDAMLKAGCPYPGHTDLLAALDGSPMALMLMVLGELRVALLSHHIPLKDVPSKIDSAKILPILKLMDHAMKTDFRIHNPKIAVLGLNPHAGEQGKIGREEITRIAPAIQAARKSGIQASGPYPADTVFHRARNGEFDALLAMYHDQGIGPLKTLDFERVVNVTLGLSFVRTSPGHGTAYDIAWQGKAGVRSLEEAFKLGRQLSRNRERSNG